MKLRVAVLSMFLFLGLSSFTTEGEGEALINVRVPKGHFINLLEWEIYTKGERQIKVTIKHQSGKQVYQIERTLYGESYNELDATDFARGKYIIEVECEGVKARAFTEKII